MPNHCAQDLYITGPTAEQMRFLNAVQLPPIDDGEDHDYEPYAILDMQFPIPDEIKNTVSPLTVVETEQEAAEKNAELQAKASEDEVGRVRYISKARQAEWLAKYGVIDWYDWCNRNWGTKWGDYWHQEVRVTKSSTKMSFFSAWGPITKGLIQVSKKYPKLTFKLWFFEQGMGYKGYDVIKDGEIIDQSYSENYRGGRGG